MEPVVEAFVGIVDSGGGGGMCCDVAWDTRQWEVEDRGVRSNEMPGRLSAEWRCICAARAFASVGGGVSGRAATPVELDAPLDNGPPFEKALGASG